MSPLRTLTILFLAAFALLLQLPAEAQTMLLTPEQVQQAKQPLKPLMQQQQSDNISISNSIDPHEAHGWDAKTSHTECGGLRRDGKLQPRCKPRPATYMGPALGTCPEGSQFDLGSWSCWTCDKSKGFGPTGAAMDSDRACARPATTAETNLTPQYSKATFLGKLCPKGDDKFEDAFFDTIRGGECWACPKGYKMNVLVHVEGPNKCTKPASEKFSYAELSFRTDKAWECVNRADGTDRGQVVFWDGYNYGGKGAGCWKCPVGFDRTVGPPVYDERACHRVEPADDTRATVRGVGKCEAKAIQDPIRGGECYKCPAGYDRIWGNSIESDKACETTKTLVFSKADLKAALTCPADQTWDPMGVNDALLANLKRAGRAAPGAKTALTGTCWKCPPNYKRAGPAPITDDGACEGEKTEWYSAPYKTPGLFGLDGAEQVVDEILTYDRGLVDDAIRELVRQCAASDGPDGVACRTNPRKEVREAWREIATNPAQSGILMNLVFGRISLVANAGRPLPPKVRPPTDADRLLYKSFAGFVQKIRLYVAEEALKAFDAWSKADQAYRAALTGESARVFMVSQQSVAPPPDWYQQVQDAMIGTVSTVGVAAAGAGIVINNASWLRDKVVPHAKSRLARMAQKEALKDSVEKGGETAVKKLTQKIAGEAAKEFAKDALKFLKGAGPAFAVAVVVEVIVELATNFDEYSKTDRPHLLTMIANAQLPVDLQRDMQTDERADIVNGYWIMAVSGYSKPSAPAAARIKSTAEEMMGPEPVWTALPGTANDVGASANALWRVGTNPVPGGGYGISRWDGQAWVTMPNRNAMRIDVASNGNAWIVDSAGHIARWTGSEWAAVPGENAQDIGIGADGTVWFIGSKGDANGPKADWCQQTDGGYCVYRWNPANPAANKWEQMGPQARAMRIDVDPNGNAWVVNGHNDIFRWNGSTWIQLPGKARDIGIGPDFSVFVVGNNGTVHRWEPDLNTWVMRDGLLNEITVGPKGVPVGVNSGKQIWLGYR